MTSMTIRNLDPEVKQGLRLRAAKNGRSMEQEVRSILRDVVVETPVAQEREASLPRETEEEIERDVRFILSLGQRLNEPFDLKKFSDDLSDGTE